MNVLLYVSAAIAALSLLLIAIFVIMTLKSAKTMMGDMTETIKRMESKINKVTDESERLMNKTNEIAEDVNQKVKSLEGLTQSAANLRKTTETMNHSFGELSKEIANPPRKYVDLMEKATALTETASRVYSVWKRRKSQDQRTQSSWQTGTIPPSRQLEMPEANTTNQAKR